MGGSDRPPREMSLELGGDEPPPKKSLIGQSVEPLKNGNKGNNIEPLYSLLFTSLLTARHCSNDSFEEPRAFYSSIPRYNIGRNSGQNLLAPEYHVDPGQGCGQPGCSPVGSNSNSCSRVVLLACREEEALVQL